MSWEMSEYRRDLWLPGLVGLVGVLLALAGWWVLVSDRREQLLDATRKTALETREAIELALAEQVDSLRGLAAHRSRFGIGPVPEWSESVEELVDSVPGLSAAWWIDLDEPGAPVAVGEGRSEPAVPLDIEEVRRQADTPRLVGPARDASGQPVYRIFLPVETLDHHRGVLASQFQVSSLLEKVLRARARGYALSVAWNGEEIFSRGDPALDRRWWVAEEEVALPFGGQWRVVQRPTRAFAAQRLTPVPHYLLAVGLLLALVLALASHQLRVIARQSRFLAASNRALERRGQELESKVEERTEELREAIDELEAFNYSVSHDLRSPLGAILNFAAILEEDYRDRPFDREGLEILARIRGSASRATALLEDLLRLSRAGRSALTLEDIDMTALARESFAQARAAEGDAEIELLVEALPAVRGDRSLLGDVFTNLFSNALKYSRDREKRRVEVRGWRLDGECIYEVSDNGEGFDMRFVDKLFGLFERLHSSEEIEGTGIGLAMVARIARRHGGRVWAEGTPGEGARFFFAIPSASAKRDPEAS